MSGNLPPGCTTRMIDEAAGVYDNCQVCSKPVDDCICPECPICSTHGDPKCYQRADLKGHGLQISRPQEICRQKTKVWKTKEALQEEETYLQQLEDESQDWEPYHLLPRPDDIEINKPTIRTRFWESEEGSSTAVQFRTDSDPMVHLHTNIGWVPISNAPKNVLDAEQFAANIAESYKLVEVEPAKAQYMLGENDD